MKQPNILIVVLDSMRADHMACYGYDRSTTPTLDRIASQGCLFETAITAAPFSPASYASIMSNLYPHQHGVNGDTVRIWPDHWPRLPERMGELGYETFCISNNSFVTEATNATRGFDTFIDLQSPRGWGKWTNKVYARLVRHFGPETAKRFCSNENHCRAKGDSMLSVDQALSITKGSSKPFFGFMILMDPHTPYRIGRSKFVTNHRHARKFFRQQNNRTMWVEQMALGSTLSAQERQVVTDLYDSEIHHSDAAIAKLVEALEARGVLDDTILVFASDHGESFGEHGVWGHGFSLCDYLTRVPLIVRHPNYWPAGVRSQAIVQLHDVHDLCLSVGKNGTPAVQDHPMCLTQASKSRWAGREFAFSEFPRQSKTLQFMHNLNPRFDPGVWDHGMWSVRATDRRFLSYDDGTVALYDLASDPQEQHSVHQDRPDELARFEQALTRHKQGWVATESEPKVEEEVDEAVLERLRSLGYID